MVKRDFSGFEKAASLEFALPGMTVSVTRE
jgi:hypothetical protein